MEVIMSSCLWIDSNDNGPFGSDWASDYDEAVDFMTENNYDVISLTYDIDTWHHGKQYTGYHVLLWLYDKMMRGGYVPDMIKIHSTNRDDKLMMEEFINSHLVRKESRNDF